jgi:hypothetical protein
MSTKAYIEIPDEQTKRTKNEKKRKKYSQTSRLESPEDFSLHNNHEKIPVF